MGPRTDSSPDEADDARPSPAPDGGEVTGFDDAALYSVVRAAVKDALFDVLGTVLLVGIGFVLVMAGIQAVFRTQSLPAVTLGVWLIAIGVYLAATALELVPSVWDWF